MTQRTFNIELRVNYKDSGKNNAMMLMTAKYARMLHSVAELLRDGQPSEIALWNEDDFVSGRQDIDLFLGADDVTGSLTTAAEAEPSISPDVLEALKQL